MTNHGSRLQLHSLRLTKVYRLRPDLSGLAGLSRIEFSAKVRDQSGKTVRGLRISAELEGDVALLSVSDSCGQEVDIWMGDSFLWRGQLPVCLN